VALPVFQELMLAAYGERLVGRAPALPEQMEARITRYLRSDVRHLPRVRYCLPAVDTAVTIPATPSSLHSTSPSEQSNAPRPCRLDMELCSMPYTYTSIAIVWLIVLGLFALSASGAVAGRWLLLLLLVALGAPALVLRRSGPS